MEGVRLVLLSSWPTPSLISLLTPNIDIEHGEIFLEDSSYNDALYKGDEI